MAAKVALQRFCTPPALAPCNSTLKLIMKKSIYPFLLFYPLLGLAQEVTMDDLLEMSLEELMQVRIETASKVAEKIGEVPASVVLLTRQDLQRYGYTSLEEILRHVPGMYQVDSINVGGPIFGVRGYSRTDTLNKSIIILVNGVNHFFDYEGSYRLPAVPVEAIDRIEIVRGPLSVTYGNGAFFGAINIITNEVATTPGLASRLSVMGGSKDSSRWFGRTSYTHPNGQVVVNASTYQTAGLDVPYRELESKSIGDEGNLTTGGRLENAEDYLELSGNYQNFSFSLTQNQTNREGFSSGPTVKEGSLRETDLTLAQISYQTALSKHWSITGKLTYTNTEVHIVYDGPNLQDRIVGNQDVQSTGYEGEVNLLWQPSPMFNWSNGWYYRLCPTASEYLHVPASLNTPSLHQATKRLVAGEEVATWAWFSQWNYSPNPRWKWVAGLRLEQTLGYTVFSEYGSTPTEYQSFTPRYEDQDVAVIPRLAAIYTPNEKHIFKWMYGKAISSPSLGQNVWNRVTPDLPPLEAEEIETFEFDYLTYFSPRYLMTLNLFQNRLQNLIGRTLWVTPDGVYQSILGNSGKLTTTGIELGLQAQPTESLQLELSTTYQDTEEPDYSDREPNYSPAWLGQFKLGYQWTPKVAMGLTGYYVSSMESQFDVSLKNPDGSVGGRIGQGSENYSVWNLNLRYEDWLTKGTFANVHLYNLFDQEIRYPTFTVNRWADKGGLGWDRSVMVTVGYEF